MSGPQLLFLKNELFLWKLLSNHFRAVTDDRVRSLVR